jgi:uncharacterized protein YegL
MKRQKRNKFVLGAAVLLAVAVLSAALGPSVKSALAASKAKTGKVNLVLCLDDSGSMHSMQKDRNDAAVGLVDQLSDQVNFGALYFQYKVTMESGIKYLGDAEERQYLMTSFLQEEHEKDKGNTNVGEALDSAMSMIEEYEEETEKTLPSEIILFTDGKNDFLNEDGERVSKYVDEANEATKEAAQQAKNAGIPIHTICLNEEDMDLLQEISQATGGTYQRIDEISELSSALSSVAAPYKEENSQGGKFVMAAIIVLVLVGIGGVSVYYFRNFKKQEYLLDYQVDRMNEEIDERNKREELDIQIREEQKKKPFYLDIVLTHGNAIGGRSCFDNEGKRRTGICSIGDILMIGRNQRGEDYAFRIDEAGLEIWATFDENELILRSKKTPFEIRKEGTARDQGTRTQKANIKGNQQYYIILGTKHEIGLLATREI